MSTSVRLSQVTARHWIVRQGKKVVAEGRYREVAPILDRLIGIAPKKARRRRIVKH